MENNSTRIETEQSNFEKSLRKMVATNSQSYTNPYASIRNSMNKSYTLEEVQRIIDSGSIEDQILLSRNYYNKDGFYSRLMLYYATLLCWYGVLIPEVLPGKNLSTKKIQSLYYNASTHVHRMKLRSLCVNFTLKACVNGCYYGAIVENSKEAFSIIDLPPAYCRTRYKDVYGNDLVEFNLSYFSSIYSKKSRMVALNTYPSIFKKNYYKYMNGKLDSPWLLVPADIGVCFSLTEDGRPRFINIIPTSIQYDEAVKTEMRRDEEEIKKIIVQKIPHLNDGNLVFEPIEAEQMHKGSVDMLKHNDNISVLTTYADVDSIASKTSSDTSHDNLTKMVNNIYSQAGTSSQLFASNGNLTLDQSINNDMALMMILAEKYSNFVTNMVNRVYGKSSISFSYKFLPITWYNKTKEIESGLKLANSGYSFLYPAIAMGFEQNQLYSIKVLENDILGLKDCLIPLQTSYTQSNSGEAGAPEKDPSEKSPKTIANEKSLDKGGTESA